MSSSDENDELDKLIMEDKKDLPLGAAASDAYLKSVDRLERKKNREKKRRNEVNDRFMELMDAVFLAEKSMFNPPSGEHNKSAPTRSDSLERATRVVYALIRENTMMGQVSVASYFVLHIYFANSLNLYVDAK